jgi:hypothetical protein
MEVLQRTANRGSIATGGYDIANSVKIEADNAEVFKRTYGSGGNVQKWTFSVWYKRTELTGGRIFGLQTNGNTFLQFSSDKLRWYVGGNDQYTEAVYRDTSAWYHIVLQFDTTQATASNRTKIYVNGVQQTLTGSYVNQYTSSIINSATTHGLGGNEFFNSEQVNGYMAEVHFVDGQALEPSDFGEYDEDSGIWKPKEYEGTYGTTGWYLDFEDAANLGDDVSGNNNHWTETNITSADQATDTPTNNFCTLNPLVQYLPDGAYSFISEGATKARSTQFDVNYTYASTFGVTSGKWYAEFEYEGSQADNLVGILDIDAVVSYNKRLGETGQWSVGLYQFNGTLYVTSDSGVTSTPSWGASAADGDIISVALDMDNYFVYFAKNGTWQNSGVPTSGATGTGGVAFDSNKTVGIGCSTYALSADGIIFTNLGGYTAGTISSAATDANGYGTFEYAPPSGYYALCTKNLAEYG